jgi:hypothetical protein
MVRALRKSAEPLVKASPRGRCYTTATCILYREARPPGSLLTSTGYSVADHPVLGMRSVWALEPPPIAANLGRLFGPTK